MEENPGTYCGYVAIMGRPNVGKSTLLNTILGEKLSITSRKPQTTRYQILGVKTEDIYQVIYVDTPGLHLDAHRPQNRAMNKAAKEALKDVDVILFVIEGLKWTEEDEWVFKLISRVQKPIVVALNKVDEITDKAKLLPYLKSLSEMHSFSDIIPISARNGTNVNALQEKLKSMLPESVQYFPEDQITDRPLTFRIEEIIREKIVRILGQELPYTTSVEIQTVQEETNIHHIHAIIWVEREGQKPIVIGKNGERLKEIGIQARRDLERLLGHQVNLKLWVKVKKSRAG